MKHNHGGKKGADVTECLADLLSSTVAANHPGGQLHGVVLVLIVAHVTGVSTATAGKPGSSNTVPPSSSRLGHMTRRRSHLNQRWLCL